MLPTEIPNPSFLHSALLILQITVTLGQKVVVFYKTMWLNYDVKTTKSLSRDI